MDKEHFQALSERDQLWASLRSLTQEIETLARGEFTGSERERQMVQLLARIICQELTYRASEGES
jgi:hypothetical protein